MAADLVKTNLLADLLAENVKLDENVIAAIPDADQANRTHAAGHGESYWTNTACVELGFPDGREKKYFLKVAAGDRGRGMMEGEFESMKVIHTVTPDFAPKPIAWGTFKSNPELHFFLCDFREMDNELPEVNKFAENLAKLHYNSVSPTGKFGFHVTTYNGNIPQDVRWADTWEECFVLGTKRDFELEALARGTSDELEALKIPLFEKVIPRLLRPLETGGRKLKPCFVHGDLWYGNTSNDISSEEPLVFDAAGFYGHNEFDVKAMRIVRYQFGRNYMNAYHSYYPISPPEDDLDARLALYSLRSFLHESTLFISDPKCREELIAETRKLVEMFPDGLESQPNEPTSHKIKSPAAWETCAKNHFLTEPL